MDKKEIYWLMFKEIISEIFKISLISYLVFYLIESFKSGFITDYFNLNILLIITILSGIFTVLVQSEEEKREPQKIKKRDYIFIVILGVVAAGLIYYKIKGIGWLSYVISIISGIIIILLSILLLNEPENDQRRKD